MPKPEPEDIDAWHGDNFKPLSDLTSKDQTPKKDNKEIWFKKDVPSMLKNMSEVPLPKGAKYYPPEHIQQASELPDQTPHIDLDELIMQFQVEIEDATNRQAIVRYASEYRRKLKAKLEAYIQTKLTQFAEEVDKTVIGEDAENPAKRFQQEQQRQALNQLLDRKDLK